MSVPIFQRQYLTNSDRDPDYDLLGSESPEDIKYVKNNNNTDNIKIIINNKLKLQNRTKK